MFLHVGSNDVKRSRTPDDVAKGVGEAIESIRKKFSNATLVVSGIIHRRDIPCSRISAINTAIESVCKSKSCKFVNANTVLCDYDLARDGLHLNRKGSRIFSDFLISCAKNGY